MLQTSDDNSVSEKEKHRANVMTFLRKKGAVGKNKDFSTAMGVDEGPVGKNRSEGAFGKILGFDALIVLDQNSFILTRV